MHFVFRTILKVARGWADGERVDLRGGALKLKCWRRFCKMPKCNQGHSFGLQQHARQNQQPTNWTFPVEKDCNNKRGPLGSCEPIWVIRVYLTPARMPKLLPAAFVFHCLLLMQSFPTSESSALSAPALWHNPRCQQRWSLTSRLSSNFQRFQSRWEIRMKVAILF